MQKMNINNFEEKIYLEEYDNGFKTYFIPIENKSNYFVLLGVRYGANDVRFYINDKQIISPYGTAHFLEHKIFDCNDIDPFEFYARSGSNLNAATGDNYTTFYFSGNKDFSNNLNYLLKWIFNFKTTNEKIEKEKNIILEEKMMHKDNFDRELYEKSRFNIFTKHPKKITNIGKKNDINRINKEDIDNAYNSFYTPNNMFLIIVGNFEFEEAKKIVSSNINTINKNKATIKKETYDEDDFVAKEYEEIICDINIPKMVISYKINKSVFNNLSIDSYTLDYYLNMIMNLKFNTGSDSRESLDKKNIFIDLNYSIDEIPTHYIIDIYITTDKIDKCHKEIDKVINSSLFNKEEFDRTKKTWIASEIKIIDVISTTAYNVFDDVLDYKEFKNNKIEDIRSLTFDKCCEVYKCIKFNNTTTLVMKNVKEDVH